MPDSGIPLPQLREMFRGSPFHRLFEMDIAQTDVKEELVVQLKYTSAVERIPGGGQYHGGVLASIGDIAGTFLILSLVGFGGATIHFSIEFLRPAVKTDVFAKAKVRRLGKTVAVIDVDIQDAKGELVAVGRGVYALMR